MQNLSTLDRVGNTIIFLKLISYKHNFYYRIDRTDCIIEVMELFKRHQDIISGFNKFLPEWLAISCVAQLRGSIDVLPSIFFISG